MLAYKFNFKTVRKVATANINREVRQAVADEREVWIQSRDSNYMTKATVRLTKNGVRCSLGAGGIFVTSRRDRIEKGGMVNVFNKFDDVYVGVSR